MTDVQGERIEIPVGDLVFDATLAGPADGPVVILLHGFPETSYCWRNQIAALAAAGYRVLAPDQRGYSPRARPAEVSAYDGPHLRADVVAFADHLGADRFHLVGHDWGGAVAWAMAAEHGDRVDHLAVLSTPHPSAFAESVTGSKPGEASNSAAGDADQQGRSSYILMFRQEGSEKAFVEDDCAGLKFLFEATGMSAESSAPYVEALGTEDAMKAALNWYRAVDLDDTSRLGPITVPTMYVWSTEDPALGRRAAEATAEYVEGPYRFEVLDGVGHWLAEDVPDQVNELLLAHFGSP